jgi:hypothetical protein
VYIVKIHILDLIVSAIIPFTQYSTVPYLATTYADTYRTWNGSLSFKEFN